MVVRSVWPKAIFFGFRDWGLGLLWDEGRFTRGWPGTATPTLFPLRFGGVWHLLGFRAWGAGDTAGALPGFECEAITTEGVAHDRVEAAAGGQGLAEAFEKGLAVTAGNLERYLCSNNLLTH